MAKSSPRRNVRLSDPSTGSTMRRRERSGACRIRIGCGRGSGISGCKVGWKLRSTHSRRFQAGESPITRDGPHAREGDIVPLIDDRPDSIALSDSGEARRRRHGRRLQGPRYSASIDCRDQGAAAPRSVDAERASASCRRRGPPPRLNHPNIVTIYEIVQAEGTEFIVDGVRGRQNAGPADHSTGSTGTGSIEILHSDCRCVGESPCGGHRASRPEAGNIMFADDGQVKILDFGLAKLTEPASDSTVADNPDDYGLRAEHRGRHGDRHRCLHVSGAGRRQAGRWAVRYFLVRRGAV